MSKLSQSPLSLNRRQPLLEERPEETTLVRKDKQRRVGEVIGGTAADCAAIWCCCPCMTVNLLVLAVYKVPSAIVRKAWRKQRRRMHRNNNSLLLLQQQQQQQQQQHNNNIRGRSSMEILESSIRNQIAGGGGEDESTTTTTTTEEEEEFEREMWSKFYGTGFWRSPSQREEI